MTAEGRWPALDRVADAFGFVPSRTGSVISTVYGDAVLPRGGTLALADLLALMRHLGASEGVVRTAVSRLARDGVLSGRRIGRSSAYALSPAARTEFEAAVPAIYGALDSPWDGHLFLFFPEGPADRDALPASGTVAPGVLLALHPAPPGTVGVEARGTPESLRSLAARAWPTGRLAGDYRDYLAAVEPLAAAVPPTPLDAMAARTLVLHGYRRLALRTPRIPAPLRPEGWIGNAARDACASIYARLASASEIWLDGTNNGSGPLPKGPDPLLRFAAAES